MSKSGILDVRLIWEKLRHFFWKLFQVSGPGTNQSWTHTLTIFEVEYYKQIFWYPIGSLHRFKFLLYTSEHPSVKKWSWCFITCRYINIALKWSRNTHHILKSQIWRFLDILSFLHQWCMAGCLSPFQGCHKERSKSYEFLYFFLSSLVAGLWIKFLRSFQI